MKRKNKKNTFWVVFIVICNVILLSGIVLAIIYFSKQGIDKSNITLEQEINNIYASMTSEALSGTLTSTPPDTAQNTTSTAISETIAPERLTIQEGKDATEAPPVNASGTIQPLSNHTEPPFSTPPEAPPAPTQDPDACECNKFYLCADFEDHFEAQACFLHCGGSASNNWSNLDKDQDGQACSGPTYP